MSVQKYSEQEIEEVLGQIKELVSQNKFIISTGENRVKNDEFADEFNLDSFSSAVKFQHRRKRTGSMCPWPSPQSLSLVRLF